MRKYLVLLSLLGVLFLVGCNFAPPVANQKGNLQVSVKIPEQLQSLMSNVKLASAGFDVTKVQIRLTKGVEEQSATVNLTDGQTSVSNTFSNLKVGEWKVDVTVLDNENYSIYKGSSTAIVVQNTTSKTEVVLQPVNGGLNIIVNFPEDMGLNSGKVKMTHPLNGGNQPQEVNANLTFDGTQASASIGNLYPSAWQLYISLYNQTDLVTTYEDSIEILPGRTITAVMTIDGLGNTQVEIYFELPPSVPTGLLAESHENGVYLKWDANPEENIAGYRVYRSVSQNGNKILLDSDLVTATEYTDTTVQKGTVYYYWVRAIAFSGMASSLTQPVSIQFGDYTPQYGNIEGQVHFSDQANHSGISVKMAGKVTVTDQNGYYQFTNVLVGNYVVEMSYDGYYPTNVVANVKANETITVETRTLYPVEVYGSVSGYAKYIDRTGHGGIAIQIQTLDGEPLPDLIATTDSNGYFSFPKVPVNATSNEATYIFTAFALDNTKGYATDSMQVTVKGNQNTHIEKEFILRFAGIEVMIFADDTTPWESTALAEMLQQLQASYQIYSSSDIPNVVLPLNKIVWIINDQYQDFYNVYGKYQQKFDQFVLNGGTMLFEACDLGWNNGSLINAGSTLPGGVINQPYYCSTNTVVNPTHPMMTGVDVNLVGSYASHNWFTNLPDDHTILTVDDQNNPTLVEYRYGKGRVIATGQPLEHCWAYGYNPKAIYPNMIYYTFNMPINGAVGEQATIPLKKGVVPSHRGKL